MEKIELLELLELIYKRVEYKVSKRWINFLCHVAKRVIEDRYGWYPNCDEVAELCPEFKEWIVDVGQEIWTEKGVGDEVFRWGDPWTCSNPKRIKYLETKIKELENK